MSQWHQSKHILQIISVYMLQLYDITGIYSIIQLSLELLYNTQL